MEQVRFDAKSLELSIDTPMEHVMIELLRKLKIDSASWKLAQSKNFYQITFMVDDYCQDTVLNLLSEWGIGEREGSSVSMLPCPFYNKPHAGRDDGDPDFEEEYVLLIYLKITFTYNSYS